MMGDNSSDLDQVCRRDIALAVDGFNRAPGLKPTERQVGIELVSHFNKITGRCALEVEAGGGALLRYAGSANGSYIHADKAAGKCTKVPLHSETRGTVAAQSKVLQVQARVSSAFERSMLTSESVLPPSRI
jgi:hypothetical protein